jgi:hypothetical protein
VAAITPMMGVKKGRMLMLSTPAGKHPDNFFSNMWHDPEFDGYKVRITADECPETERRMACQGAAAPWSAEYREEYYCEFLDSAMAAFPC